MLLQYGFNCCDKVYRDLVFCLTIMVGLVVVTNNQTNHVCL